MDEKPSSQDPIGNIGRMIAPVVAPLIPPGFAFSFVIGYFLFYDISWFSFFSFSEHVVFALRALPIALGVSMILVIVLSFGQSDDQRKRWALVKRWLVPIWLVFLGIAALCAILSAHLALFLIFAFMIVGELLHYRHPLPRDFAANALYWATTLMMLSLMTGYLSAYASRFFWELDRDIDCYFPLKHPFIVTFKAPASQPEVGQIIFVGSSGILFYDYHSRATHLLRPDDIASISERVNPANASCRGNAPQAASPH